MKFITDKNHKIQSSARVADNSTYNANIELNGPDKVQPNVIVS